MTFRSPLLALTALAAALAGAGPPASAVAQIATRSNAPIDITADQAEVVQSKCLAVWRGAAEAVQSKARLRADTITVFSRPKARGSESAKSGQEVGGGCGGTERIEADGHVFYVTPERTARGDRAVYTQANDQIVMTGDVIVVQGQDVARGARLIIDVANHQARMVSASPGAGKAGRVRGVYFPASDNNPSAPKPDAAPVHE